MARPKRTEGLQLKLSKSEKAAVGRLAELEGGLSQADTVRRLIRAEAQKQGVWTPTAKESRIPDERVAI